MEVGAPLPLGEQQRVPGLGVGVGGRQPVAGFDEPREALEDGEVGDERLVVVVAQLADGRLLEQRVDVVRAGDASLGERLARLLPVLLADGLPPPLVRLEPDAVPPLLPLRQGGAVAKQVLGHEEGGAVHRLPVRPGDESADRHRRRGDRVVEADGDAAAAGLRLRDQGSVDVIADVGKGSPGEEGEDLAEAPDIDEGALLHDLDELLLVRATRDRGRGEHVGVREPLAHASLHGDRVRHRAVVRLAVGPALGEWAHFYRAGHPTGVGDLGPTVGIDEDEDHCDPGGGVEGHVFEAEELGEVFPGLLCAQEHHLPKRLPVGFIDPLPGVGKDEHTYSEGDDSRDAQGEAGQEVGGDDQHDAE